MRRQYRLVFTISLNKGKTSDEQLDIIAANVRDSILNEVLIPKDLNQELEVVVHDVQRDWDEGESNLTAPPPTATE